MRSALPAPGTPRVLVLATLVNTIGNGAYLASSALFLTRSVGLTPAQLALALSVAAGVGMVLTTPMGYLVDRVGPRAAQITALLTSAAALAALALVRDLRTFIPLACLIAVSEAMVRAANGAMIAGAVPAADRVRTRAFVRSTNNAGIAIGMLAAGLPLLLDSRAAYLATVFGNALTCLMAALIISRAHPVVPVPVPAGGSRLVALRDRPFLAFALLDGMLAALLNGMLALALPLWLIAHTDASAALVSAALLVNTIGCVTLQVWTARDMHHAADAPPATRRGALLLAASCVLLAVATGAPTWLVVVLVLAAAVVHVLGELRLAGATFVVVFDLAQDWAHGQYQAVHQTGRQLGNMAAPPLLTAMVVAWGAPGWLVLAAIFTTAGLIMPVIIGWALRSRSRATGLAPAPDGLRTSTSA
ncbi:MFS transporter [Actinoplanes sp. NEAU-A11]|uniref:MFS transporter n=1 Tax=Actinoplanes aureus TaxID=2792083 RepID=A0A931G151_9ACTN|nr:MFS transporter [Actinoplanes aureus]